MESWTSVCATKRAYLVLQQGVDPAIVDTQGDKVDRLARHGAGRNRSILRLEVRGELGAVVAAVRLSEQGKVTAF